MFLTKAALVLLLCAQICLLSRGQTECKNNVSWCTSLYLGQCYTPYVESRCCKFCMDRRKPNPNCRYGDESSLCAAQYCRSNPIRCCETCLILECRNNADWCSTIYPGQCYTKTTETTCCKRCRELLQTRNPACRYGNEVSWCSPQTCNNKSVNCCGSCPPPTECKDNATWCSSILPGDCYARSTEQTCCQTCRWYLHGDLSCRYGDEAPWPWCQPERCTNPSDVERCCRTCSKFYDEPRS